MIVMWSWIHQSGMGGSWPSIALITIMGVNPRGWNLLPEPSSWVDDYLRESRIPRMNERPDSHNFPGKIDWKSNFYFLF